MATKLVWADDRAAHVMQVHDKESLIKGLKNRITFLQVATAASFLAMSFFVVKYFAGGSLSPSTWNGEQWLNALLGLMIAAIIATCEYFLFSGRYKGLAALLGTFAVIAFSYLAEISQSMERSDAVVQHRSHESPVFKAALNAIGTVSNAPAPAVNTSGVSYASANVAKIQSLIESKNKCQSCVPSSFKDLRESLAQAQSQLAQAQATINAQAQVSSAASSGALQSAIAQAKSLENDTDHQYAIIKLFRSMFELTPEGASFLFSSLIMCAFLVAHLFAGSEVHTYREALTRLGLGGHKHNTQSLRTDTQTSVYVPPIDTHESTAETQADNKAKRLILLEVHDALRGKQVQAITQRNDGELFRFLKEAKSESGEKLVTGSNDRVMDVLLWVVDSLLAEGIIKPNPDKGNARNKPDYVVDYDNAIFKK